MIDGIEHCPCWLRISDQPIKAFINKKRPEDRTRKTKKKSRKKMVTVLSAYRVDEEGNETEVYRGTYREMCFMTSMPSSTIQNYVFRKVIHKPTGLRFKKVGSERAK